MIKVYYHKNCFDGMASALVAYLKFQDKAQYIPINYGEDTISILQDCYENAIINDDIYFIDFSLPRELMDLIFNKANNLVVIDHHKTAQKTLEGTSYSIFDMNYSGAQLAWKYFFPDMIEPELISYIGDRDLWNFKLENSKEINAYIQSFDIDLTKYVELYYNFNKTLAIEVGKSLVRYQDKLTNDMIKNLTLKSIGGYLVPVVNATVLFSEVGNRICLNEVDIPFAANYFDRDIKRQWGLRSIGDFDVSEIAKKYGGGGHKNAAGFITDKNWLGD